MNKVLPVLLIVVIGLGIAAGAFFFFNKKDAGNTPLTNEEEEETLKELSLEEKPYVTLTPRADGHEFHLTIEKIPSGSELVEYELIYKNADGVTQGVPGSIKYKGEKMIERDLLLGSCSSGKCKYDEGVEEGTFTLKLRNGNGKLIAKMDTPFHLQENPTKISSTDGKLSISGTFSKGFYLTMGTFGLPKATPSQVVAGPYGVFTKATGKINATVTLGDNTYVFTGGNWSKLTGGKTTSLGTFVSTSE